MSRRVLLVFAPENRDWRNRIEAHLDDEAAVHGAEAIDVDTAPTAEAAARKFRELRYDLVVADLSLVPAAGAPLSDRGGLLLLESMRGQPGTRRMLVVPGLSDDIKKRCEALPIPAQVQKFEANLAEQVARALHSQPAAPPPLNVIIYAKQNSHWSYVLHNGSSARPEPGTLRVTPSFSRLLRKFSERVHGGGDWNSDFKDLGESLIEHFCGEDNPKFADDLRDALAGAAGVENTRVSFVVEQAHFNIALEALLAPNVPVPWMVRAPLFRNVSGSVPLSPGLFGSARRSLRALIVCADASGFVNGQTDQDGNVLRYRKLKAVQKECSTILQMLAELQRKGEPIEAVPFPPPGRQRVERGELLRRLEEPWDIVHIAGHAKYLEREQRGVLIIGGEDCAQELDITKATPFLKKARLLYLSSCESANAPFAVAAARAGVPAVVGYRWPVDDRLAAMHARLFYRSLFKHQSLEIAFLRTRRAMHRRFEADPIWASSMLVMGEH